MKRKQIARISLPMYMIREVDAIYGQVGPVQCKGKCSDSCSPIGNLMTDFERDRIIARVGYGPNEFTADIGASVKCNLLTSAGRCSVYDIRPMICRLWSVDQAIPCRAGCAGTNCLPPNAGRLLMNRVDQATAEYTSPIKRRA